MKDKNKTKKQLIDELAEKNKRLAELEALETQWDFIKNAGEEKEKLLKDILTIIQDGISILDQEYNIIDINPVMAKWFAHHEPIIGKKCYKVFHGLSEPCEICPAVETLKNGKQTVEIVPFKDRDGLERWMELFTFPYLDSKTFKMIGVIEYVRDITEQRMTKETLFEEKRKFEAIVACLGYGISIQDRDFRILYQNQVHKKYRGGHPGEYCYKAYEHEEKICQECPVALTFKDGNIHTMEKSVTTDRGINFFEITASPLRDSTGTITAGIEIVRDITERKKAEEDLKLFRHLINQSNDAIFVIDPETARFLNINDTTCSNLGYTRKVLLNMTVMEIETMIPDRASWNKHVEEMKVKGSLLMEGRHLRKDGTTFPVEVNVKYVSQDEKDYMIAVVRDMTKRKDLESQFFQAQKMEAIGQFAGGIAHDFNNLITAINGHSELLLLDHKPGDSDYDHIKTIRETADRAAQLVRQLMDFSRKQSFDPIHINLNEVIQNVSGMFTRLIGEDIEYEIILDPNLKPVKADPGQIEQVILNLVINARYAMPRGGKLTISSGQKVLDETYCQFHPLAKPGEHVILTVADSGCGMTDETQVKVFEPFFTTKTEGTGLGLSTVYGIIKKLNGQIDVYSEVGKGSVFEIYLPALVREDTGKKEEPIHIHEETLPRGNETILVIDDETSILKLTNHVLSRLGYTVLSAKREKEAYKKIRKHRRKIDLLLTDVVLPGRYGPEIAETLKAEFPELKVLFMSGYVDDRIPWMEEGVHFLSKPFTQSLLANKVREVLDEQESKGEMESAE